MAPRRKATLASLPHQPTAIPSQQDHVLVESLVVDDEGSTLRNKEHSISRELFHPDPPPLTMANIERIDQQLNANMQCSLQDLIAGIL